MVITTPSIFFVNLSFETMIWRSSTLPTMRIQSNKLDTNFSIGVVLFIMRIWPDLRGTIGLESDL